MGGWRQKIISEVASIKNTLAELNALIASSKQKQSAAEAECKRLQKEMDDFKNNKDSKLKQIKVMHHHIGLADIVQKKSNMSKTSTTVKAMQREVQGVDMEIEQLASDVSSAKKEVEEAAEAVDAAKQEHEALKAKLQQVKEEHARADNEYKQETKRLDVFRRELADMEKAKQAKLEVVGQVDSTISSLRHKIDSFSRERKGAHDVIERIENTYEWVAGAKKSALFFFFFFLAVSTLLLIFSTPRLFGQPGSEFDFSGHRMKDKKSQLERLEADQHKMRKKVNPKVLHMIDRHVPPLSIHSRLCAHDIENQKNGREKELTAKHSTVIKDKGKIEETIARLDEYKLEALTKAWSTVNGEFGQIFDTLLPGNWCELQPAEGMTLSQGLEVRVRLGSTWKSSLTELSGGQRSLIALSLIMSLLKTHPSPIYILDGIGGCRIGSATYTKPGIVIQTSVSYPSRILFKGSQFIVVSLKEGLFTNANVLFRTRFRYLTFCFP
ncbi:hypothetical protein VP01_815g5 [Puccinia sorghi]|uniref:RecF/RecN/SMC N-terminal domain-containing protein n=1 Tax=Puccinia sorghi TaxID=27349 RepID=A0A0L6UAX6_9BASI|nr:hypothetical protein VP01_815g5 [Puccinia sorghi]